MHTHQQRDVPRAEQDSHVYKRLQAMKHKLATLESANKRLLLKLSKSSPMSVTWQTHVPAGSAGTKGPAAAPGERGTGRGRGGGGKELSPLGKKVEVEAEALDKADDADDEAAKRLPRNKKLKVGQMVRQHRSQDSPRLKHSQHSPKHSRHSS